MAKSTVAVRFTGDTTSLKRSLDQADGAMGKLSGRAKVALAGVAAGAVAFGKSSVDAFVEAEASQSKLTEAFEKFPQLAGSNADALRDLNAELAKKTKFDDDATASGQAVLAQFGLTEEQLIRATPLLQDYAERTGKDLPSAAQDMGKAINGTGRAFKAVGLNLEDTGDKAGNFEQLMGGLEDQVGGFAETAGDTTAGKMQILNNQFGELQEQVGAKLIPVLIKLADVGLAIVDFFSNLSPQMQTAIGVFAAAAAAVFVIVKAVQAWTAAQAALNVVMDANPIVLIVAAVVAFIAILVIAYQKVGWFRDLVDGAFHLIQSVIMGAFNWVKSNWPLLLAILTGPIGLAVLAITKNWDKIKAGATAVKTWIVDRFNDVLGFVKGLPGKIASAASGMWDGITNAFKSAINGILRLWNSLDLGIHVNFSVPDWPGVPHRGESFGINVDDIFPDVSYLARGGVVSSPTLAVLGDGTGRNRREIATPEQLMRRIVREEGGGVTVIVQGSVLSERDLIATINKAVTKGIR